MIIDEERLFTLTKYASTKGAKNKVESDHNPLFCRFNIKFKREKIKKERICQYNFKNKMNQENFLLETNKSIKLKQIFEQNGPIEQKSEQFMQELDKLFASSFKKIRVKAGVKVDPMKELMKVKIDLKLMLKNEKNVEMKKFLKIKLVNIDLILEEYSGEENANKVENYVKYLESDTGGFCQVGMWKLKSTLCPKPTDPPMWKSDNITW